MGVVARTAVAGGRSTGSAISQRGLLSSRGYLRWNSAKHWHGRRIGGNDRPWQEYYAIPQAVGKSTAGPARHFLIDPASDLHRSDVCLVGVALVWQSWRALLMALGLIPFFDAKARREEKWLREKFSEYGEYEKCVKRFIPRIY